MILCGNDADRVAAEAGHLYQVDYVEIDEDGTCQCRVVERQGGGR